ncbi:MAG: alpha/beta fold hydrolase [Candidatus Freyarchaeota archaeon]
MPRVRVGEIYLYYESHGEGFPLVMIMGLGGPVETWDRYIIDEFSREFRVIVFDNRGSGRSDGVERAHVLGVSMGGMIAIELALRRPEMVEKLVLCSTSGGVSRFVPPKMEVLESLKELTGGSPEDALEGLLRIMYTEDFIAEHPDRIKEFTQRVRSAQFSPEGFTRQLGAIMVYDAHGRLHNIKQPTLILAGKKDVLVPYENSVILSEEIPNSKLVLFDDAAHGLHSQKREEFCRIVLEFLKNRGNQTKSH